MKTQSFSIMSLLITAILFLASCKKDPCEDAVCLNGGWCESGTCQCPPGYSGSHCEVFDPCYNANCGPGYCVSGTCQCPTGYYGTHCENQMTPAYMAISKIIVRDFPDYDQNGYYWDQSLWPEIFLDVLQNDVLVISTGYYEQCTPGTEYTYQFDSPIYSNYNSKCSVQMSDYDGDLGNVYMCGYYFYPYDNVDGFPEKITLYNSNSWHQAVMDVYVTWVF